MFVFLFIYLLVCILKGAGNSIVPGAENNIDFQRVMPKQEKRDSLGACHE